MKKLLPLILLSLVCVGVISALDTPAPGTPPPIAKDTVLADTIKERDTLKQQVADLQRSIQVMNARIAEVLAQRNEALDKLAIARAELVVAQQNKEPSK